jgi:TonB family protein
MSETPSTGSNQGDSLLWIAGGAIALMGAAWLFITKPWAGAEEPAAVASGVVTNAPLVVAMAEPIAPAEVAPTLDNPLRMAELAYEAGMLIEPEEFSAWTLYSRVYKADPANPEAQAGLTKVADDLVRRGETALDQGRFDDARTMVDRIRAALPEHPGAKALAGRIWPQAAPVAVEAAPPAMPEPERPRVARVEQPETPAPRPQVDPLVEASAGFDAALQAGRLLTPAEQSAKHFLGVLNRTNVDHELAQRARAALSQELLSRAAQSIESLDPEAAGIWIDEAEAILGGTDGAIRAARAALNEQLIAMESAKPVPASTLKIVTYVAPVYPQRANERNLEGWVDIEFTVGADGKTRNVVVTDASHESFFRREATDAVAKWQFEPRVFLGRAIEQSSYTRIRFVR